jgi:hypothetical protein
MVPSSIPKDNDIKAVLTDLLSMTMTLTMPMNTTAKYSAEENDRAILAKGGDRRSIRTPLTTPPIAEHMMAMPSAFETNPFLLSLYPSQVVGTFMGSPGMLNSIPVIDPPKTPPQ